MTTLERFKAKYKIDPSSGCWLWTAYTNYRGYGTFWSGNKVVKAHRWSYEHFIDKIPRRLELDHLCRVHNCVNPSHLEAVTHKENIRRGEGGKNTREKTHCPQGHEYNRENTRMYKGSRHCRSCQCRHQKTYLARKKAFA